MSLSSSVSVEVGLSSHFIQDEDRDLDMSTGSLKRHTHSLGGSTPSPGGVSLSTAPGKRQSCYSPGIGTGGGSWTGGGGVLGEGFQSPPLRRRWLRSLGGGLTLKSHSGGEEQRRNPRPTKTRITLERLRLGLRGCVSLAEDELSDVKSSLSDLSVSSANQAYHGCGRWLKGLEYALSLVEALGLEYERLVEMREGVRSMAYAYSVSIGPQRESALANVKAGFRECTEALCEVETKLQKLLGVFQLEIKGIQGFSRLCGGDVFEISLRHGRQKWKSRGRVGKDGRQNWDVPKASFRGVLDEVIQIKAAELKTLGKEILLGNKFCEITELFAAEPQLMTVNLNPTGSLKLNLLVTWWPLGTPEDSPENFGSSTLSISPSRKRRLPPPRQDSASEGSSNTSTLSSIHSEEETQRDTALWERSLRALTEDNQNEKKDNRKDGDWTESWSRQTDPTGNFSLGNTTTVVTVSGVESEEDEVDCGGSGRESVDGGEGAALDGKGLKVSILRLAALLEDIQGHFPELEPLHTHTKTLQRLLVSPSFHSSNSSLNVESALECFDFLDEEKETSPDRKSEKIDNFKNANSESQSKATDSGIFLGNSESPTNSLGSEEGPLLGEPWDAVLEAHVSASLKLIHKLGSYGPLRFGEKEALRKLQRHSSLIGNVLSQSNLPNGLSSHDFLSPTMDPLWNRLGGNKLLISGEEAQERLSDDVRRILKEKGQVLNKEMSQRISEVLVAQMLETREVHPGDKLTRFQMESFFRHTSLEDAVEEVVEEETLLEGLQQSVGDTLKRLPTTRVPSPRVLLYLFRCLVESTETNANETNDKRLVSKFLKELCSTASHQRQVDEAAAELLESDEPSERIAGIGGLEFLGKTSYIEGLTYLAQMDREKNVRKRAKETLRALGVEDVSITAFGGLGLT